MGVCRRSVRYFARTNGDARTVKSRGPDIPMLISTHAEASPRVEDGGQQARRTRENAKQPLKPIAQGRPDAPARTCGSCRQHFFRWRAMGAVGTRPSLRPHDVEGETISTARAHRVARPRMFAHSRCARKEQDVSTVIASAAKQSRLSMRRDSGLLRCARNDGATGEANTSHPPKKKGAPACAGAPQRSGHCRVFARTEVVDQVPWDLLPGELSSCRRARRGR